jgi:hypothetical protein
MPREDGRRGKIEKIRERIAGTELVCSGTLHVRRKTCGGKGCRCQQGPEHWHGPYYEWTRRRDGHLVHTSLSPEQLPELERAIANYRDVQRELQRWERESEQIILDIKRRKPVP